MSLKGMGAVAHATRLSTVLGAWILGGGALASGMRWHLMRALMSRDAATLPCVDALSKPPGPSLWTQLTNALCNLGGVALVVFLTAHSGPHGFLGASIPLGLSLGASMSTVTRIETFEQK